MGRLKLPGSGTGVFVYGVGDESSQFKKKFTTGVEATIRSREKLDQHVFAYSASGPANFGGETHAAIARLRLAIAPLSTDNKNVSWPRGIFNLKKLGNRFEFQLPAAPAGTFVSIEGTVLIWHASAKRIEGSVFLTKAIRVYAPLSVPQTGLPLRYVFKAVK